jgi:type I restriction-modification system DNA methylase subunit
MPTCPKCLKTFTQLSQYERHEKKKIPCASEQPQQLVNQEDPFRLNSLKLNKQIPLQNRKEQGIYFTPRPARELIYANLKTHPKSVLEPSFGSGEFLEDIKQRFPQAKLTGVELNETLYKTNKLEGNFINADFLKTDFQEQFDLIIGNPPYFITKDKNPSCMNGRPNIYVAFLYKCLTQHLTKGGTLAFVLPTSLYNSSYYEPMRKYIAKNCTITFLQSLDVKYYQTAQDTMVLILENNPDPTKAFILERNDCFFLTPHKKQLQSLLQGTTTLKVLGFQVKTGDVVWNQEKENLTSKEGTLLIYSSNIVDSTLVLDNLQGSEKKQYIKGYKKTPQTGPTILVNRGYGNVFSLNFTLVENKTFYAENHVNMIIPTTEAAKNHIETVISSLKKKQTQEFIELFVGNGALSKTELESVLPIFV